MYLCTHAFFGLYCVSFFPDDCRVVVTISLSLDEIHLDGKPQLVPGLNQYRINRIREQSIYPVTCNLNAKDVNPIRT